MPELPEVETLKRQLQEVIIGQQVRAVKVFDPKLSVAERFPKGKVLQIGRRGKILEFIFEDGQRVWLSLRMTGRLLWGNEVSEHRRLTLVFSEGNLHLIDPRRFAALSFPQKELAPLGVDPLKGAPPSFFEGLRRYCRPIKSFLMDQRFVAGIGNIYASEILYAAQIHPLRPLSRLSQEEWDQIMMSAREILTEAIRYRGTTISDWRDLYGRPGEYQKRLKVYGKEGEPCPRCGTSIRRIVVAGRGTYFCPRCQN